MTSKLLLLYIGKNSREPNQFTEMKDEVVEIEERHGESENALVLPEWLIQKPEMIYQPRFIQKGQTLGSGNYGTVFKGKLMQGNAV